MKNLLKTALCALLISMAFSAHAVYVQNMPVNKIQPSGDTVHFFVTGDEFYHRYHDADNYTIVQDHAGYWVYALPSADGGVQPSTHRVGTVNPATLGLQPGLTITRKELAQRRKAWDIPEQYRIAQPKTSGRNHGDYCNLVIFIRFADDTVYTRSLESIDRMWSDSTSPSSNSVYSYFKHVSYNKLFVRTYYAPTPDSSFINSYQSPYPRAYYMPYNESNTIGYTNYDERTQREFDLLVGAVNYLNDSAPVPTSYVLDCDNDGYIDNVNFVVKGSYTGWSDLLWPHKWNLYGHDVFINGKQVSTFNFALEGAGDDYFGTSTFCHEMFHSLGAPDLYHYEHFTEITPVGSWDLMASNSKPPQNMSAYMKYKYGNWLDSIPLITTPGTYTLTSVSDNVPGTNIYRFPSADPDQFYVVEYRDNTEMFDTKIPGKGLLIYRIDTRFNGNAGFDGGENFDEVWLFRPNSTDNLTNGYLAQAFFTPARNRTEFSPSTIPYPFLSDDTRDYTFSISNISTPGETISFYYTNRTIPANLTYQRTTSSTATLTWGGSAPAYRVLYRLRGSDEEYTQLLVHTNHLTLINLLPNTEYEWTARALFDPTGDNHYADSSALAPVVRFHTEHCNNPQSVTVGEHSHEQHTGMPFYNNENFNYSQQIFLASEIGQEKNINAISIEYGYNNTVQKENCTIYMANTTITQFNDTTPPLPLDELHMVYTGTLNFAYGWNDLLLDSIFHYTGQNLVIAIDDNSNEVSRPNHIFYINNTDACMAIIYHSSDRNPGPEQDTIKGTRTYQYFRNNIRFSGCPIYHGQVYACIISDNENFGSVTGDGLYTLNDTIFIQAFPSADCTFTHWNDNNTDNPRTIVMTQDTLFIAHFHSTVGIESPENVGGYVILSHHLQITIQGATQQPISIYDLMGRHVASCNSNHPDNVVFNLPSSGIYLVRVGQEKPIKLFVR